LDYDEEERAE